MLERRSKLASGNNKPEVCSSSVTDSSWVVFLEEYAAGFKVEAAVFNRRPSMVRVAQAANGKVVVVVAVVES